MRFRSFDFYLNSVFNRAIKIQLRSLKTVIFRKYNLLDNIPIEIKQAARRPAPEFHSSLVRKNVVIAVRPLKGH